jgi:hypothetical protein
MYSAQAAAVAVPAIMPCGWPTAAIMKFCVVISRLALAATAQMAAVL